MDSSATLTQQSTAATTATAGNGVNSNFSSFPSASSVWSSASSTMCSPAAHAIQKLFNCSSGGGCGAGAGSTTKHYGNLSSGIDSKSSALTSSSSFKTSKSELLKKKSKFWQYLEGETQSASATTTTSYEGIDSSKKGKSKR